MNTTRSAHAAADGSCVTITSVVPLSSVELAQQGQDGTTCTRVERARRLVGEDDAGGADEGTRDGDALLLPARQLRRPMAPAVVEADAPERFADRGAREPPASEPRGEDDVLLRGERGEQVERLEHEADALPPQPGERSLAEAVEVGLLEADATLGGPVEPGRELKQRRLPGARGPHHGGERAAVEGQRDAVERADMPVAAPEDADDVVEFDGGTGRRSAAIAQVG